MASGICKLKTSYNHAKMLFIFFTLSFSLMYSEVFQRLCNIRSPSIFIHAGVWANKHTSLAFGPRSLPPITNTHSKKLKTWKGI